MSDSSPNPKRPHQADQDSVREQLVAYLDGELSDELSQAVERQISEDDAVKEEIQSLDQAWNALDALPLASTSHDFTKSTIAMVTMAATQDVVNATTAMPALRKKRRWGMAALLVTFTAAGFLLSSLFVSYRDRQLIRNLPETRYAKTLNQVVDIEFLKAWSEEASKSIPSSRLTSLTKEAETWQMLSASPPTERFRWTEALPPEEMTQLSDQSIAFQSLTKLKQDRLRELNQQLGESDTADELRRYALLYEQLVSKLPPIEQASLRNMPTDERISRMRKEVRRQRDRLLLEMTDDEQKLFRQAIDKVLERIDAVDDERTDTFIREMYRRRYPDKKISKEQILLLKMRGMARIASMPETDSERRPFSFAKVNPELWNSLQSDLVKALPSRIQDEIAEAKNKSKQTQMVLFLIGNTLQSTSTTDASTYFAEELTQKEQLEYLSLTKEEMQEKLEERLSSEMLEGFEGRGDLLNQRRGRGPSRRDESAPWRDEVEGRPENFGPPRNGPGQRGNGGQRRGPGPNQPRD